MERASIDIPYIQNHHFHIERIMDYITPSTPLFSFHQMRVILLFFYFFSIIIIFFIIPQIQSGVLTIGVTVIFTPLIFTMMLHILISFCYLVFSLLAGASRTTLVGIVFYLHTSVALISFSFLIYCLVK